MNIIIPSNKLSVIKDINGNTLKSLVTNNGSLSQMRTGATKCCDGKLSINGVNQFRIH